MEHLVFLRDRFYGHGDGAGVVVDDGPDFVPEDEVFHFADAHVGFGLRIADKKNHFMLAEKPSLGVDLFHRQLDSLDPVSAVQCARAGEAERDAEIVRFRRPCSRQC